MRSPRGLDDVLDSVEAIGHRIVIFKVPNVTPQARQLAEILDRSARARSSRRSRT